MISHEKEDAKASLQIKTYIFIKASSRIKKIK
jgi:hypothetical protein